MANESTEDRPSDVEFKEHFEKLLNPEGLTDSNLGDISSDVDIPVLDKPITAMEVDHVIKHQLKSNKGCGPDGINPGILKLLPVQWILFLSMLL